jgi:hypothetical protein
MGEVVDGCNGSVEVVDASSEIPVSEITEIQRSPYHHALIRRIGNSYPPQAR